MNPLNFFILLQILDVATTMVVLAMGGSENNPIVAHLMSFGPVGGLIVSKVFVISVATAGAFLHKARGIRLANVVFCGVVVWNVSIIARLALIA
jgi:hypothetical protein